MAPFGAARKPYLHLSSLIEGPLHVKCQTNYINLYQKFVDAAQARLVYFFAFVQISLYFILIPLYIDIVEIRAIS